MASVLYLSYTGIAEPLGQSQVMQYLAGLAERHRIALVSFERPDVMSDPDRLRDLHGVCAGHGIEWHPLTYHNRPSGPATVYDIAMGVRAGTRIAQAIGADVIHARSYIPGLMALAIKRRTGARFLFDIRGFWPDERLESGQWKRFDPRYRFFKRAETFLYRGADHVVTLTRAAKRVVRDFPFLDAPPPVDVIPTCTNLDMFRPISAKRDAFTLVYVGSMKGRYLFQHVARAVAILFDLRPTARLLVLNRDSHDRIRAMLADAGVDLARVEIVQAPYSEVARHVSSAHASAFFLSTGYSLKASAPTKMGELLACGLPVLANEGVGDVAEDLRETGTGIAVADFEDATLRDAVERLVTLAEEPGIAERCRAAAEARFALADGIERYEAIYRRLAGDDEATLPAAAE